MKGKQLLFSLLFVLIGVHGIGTIQCSAGAESKKTQIKKSIQYNKEADFCLDNPRASQCASQVKPTAQLPKTPSRSGNKPNLSTRAKQTIQKHTPTKIKKWAGRIKGAFSS